MMKVGPRHPPVGAPEPLHALPAARRRPLLPHLHHLQRRRGLRGGVPTRGPVQPPAARAGGMSRHPQGGAVQGPRHWHTVRQRARLSDHPGSVPQIRGGSRIPQRLGGKLGTRALGRQGRPPEDARQAECSGKLRRLLLTVSLLFYVGHCIVPLDH